MVEPGIALWSPCGDIRTGEQIKPATSCSSRAIQTPLAKASIDVWAADAGLANVRPAIDLDATTPDWPIRHADAVVCFKMIHIAPWSAAVGLVNGAARILPAGGPLYLYGPFRREGRHTAPSNERFDRDLRRQNLEWGVRDLEAVAALADAAGFPPPIIEVMPANNLSVIFRRGPGQTA